MGGITVIGELASIGYDAEWRIVSAASVGANHRRDRIIIVAYPRGKRCLDSKPRIESNKRRFDALSVSKQSCTNVAYADSVAMDDSNLNGSYTETFTEPRTIFPAVGRSSDIGTGQHWLSEPNVGRVANGIPNRVDRLRGLGNAVVPQVAEVIGRLVISHAQHN
jgi:DNA (cytosine-5)-methyltransferase 1